MRLFRSQSLLSGKIMSTVNLGYMVEKCNCIAVENPINLKKSLVVRMI
jgi:hypothetical protein